MAGGRRARDRVPHAVELPHGVDRVDPSGRVDLIVTEPQVSNPNGLCFSPDHKKLYIASTGRGPGDAGPGGNRDIHVFVIGADNKASNGKVFTDCMVTASSAGPTCPRRRA